MVDISFILNVVFYRSEAGKEPVREWLKKLPLGIIREVKNEK
jgi:hypothetical protein